MRKAIALILAALLAGISCASHGSITRVQAQSRHSQPSGYAARQILVKYRATASPQAIASIRQRIQAQVMSRYPRLAAGLQLQQLPSHMRVQRALSLLRRNPNVEYAEPNYIYQASAFTPDDTFFPSLWGLNNTGQSGGVEDIDIDAPEAWQVTTGSSDVVVGIIDTGIDYSHQDLAANMWVNTGEIPDNGIDDDGNGFIDDIHGWDAEGDTGDPFDDSGHGTHVAGTIGAVGNNNEGVVGINWDVRLMALKFLDSQGAGVVSDALECINYAIEMKSRGVNIRVLNASWGGPGSSLSLKNAIEAAGEAGILFVAAAGNNGDGTQGHGTNDDIAPIYPASYDLSNLISVAAVDRRGELARFSNFGPGSVDVGAPGVSIASTVPFDGYALASGTSMATPHVSGAAALLLSVKPDLPVSDVKDAILQGVVPLASLEAKVLTGGMLNAFNSLQLLNNEPPFRLSFTKLQLSLRAGESIDFGLMVRSTDGFNGPVTLAASLDPNPGDTSVSWSMNPVNLTANAQESVTLTLTTSRSSTPGASTLTVEGRSGSLVHQVSLEITIEPASSDPLPVDPDGSSGFALSVTPESRSVVGGGWVAFTVNATRASNTEPVTLNVITRSDDRGLSLVALFPNPLRGDRATLILFVSPLTSPRTETLFVRGTTPSGIVEDSNDVGLEIR